MSLLSTTFGQTKKLGKLDMRELTLRVMQEKPTASDRDFVWAHPVDQYNQVLAANVAVISSAVAKFYFKSTPTAIQHGPEQRVVLTGGNLEAGLQLSMDGLKANFSHEFGGFLAMASVTLKVRRRRCVFFSFFFPPFFPPFFLRKWAWLLGCATRQQRVPSAPLCSWLLHLQALTHFV